MKKELPDSADGFGSFSCFFLMIEKEGCRKWFHELRGNCVGVETLVEEMTSCSTSFA